MARLKIAVYADCFNNKCGQTLPYMQFISQFGEIILVHPFNDMDRVLKETDVLFVPGGADVDASKYGEAPSFFNSRANAHYQYMDEKLLLPYIRSYKPVIGICRGLQAINSALGGTLHQHIFGHVQSKDRHETVDTMYLEHGGEVEINTLHHQSIDKLGEGLQCIGFSTVKGYCPSYINKNDDDCFIREIKPFKKLKGDYYCIIEAVEHIELPILAFQYHPEEFNCQYAIEKINNLLK